MTSSFFRRVPSYRVTVATLLGAANAFAQAAPPAPAAPPPPDNPAPPGSTPGATPPAATPPAPAAPAAPAKPPTVISGHIEGAYHRTFGSPDYSKALLTRAYDTANGFQLHAAHVQLKHQATEHVTGVIEFDAGSDAAVNNFTITPLPAAGSGAQLFDVQEAYASYSNYGVTFTAGKFVTYEGIEVVEGPSNPTITRGFLYYLAEPVTHVGAKLHYATGPVDVGIGLVNGWDTNGRFYTADNNDMKTGIFRVGITPVPQFFAAVSGTYGVEVGGATTNPRMSLDLTGAVIPTDMITINFQANMGNEKAVGLPDAAGNATDASWYGFGLQPVLKVDAITVGARYEYFKDKNGSRSLALNSPAYQNFTITPGYTFDGAFTLRAELRHDIATEEILGVDGNKKNQTTFAIGAHYVF
ncbi:MAG TPA: outer membrane beta-barrel protein [Polyangiaceae bacterium]